jgi:hypothetical protein
LVIINFNFILGNQITCGRIEPQFCKELCPLQHKLPPKTHPQKHPNPPSHLRSCYSLITNKQSRMPKSPKDTRKLLQLHHQQQKGPKPNKINMEVDVDVVIDQQQKQKA